MIFHAGDIWEPEATIKNPRTGALDEPSTVSFTFKSPKGRETSPLATKQSEAKWTSTVELTEPGIWKVSVKTTSPKGSQPAQVRVAGEYNIE